MEPSRLQAQRASNVAVTAGCPGGALVALFLLISIFRAHACTVSLVEVLPLGRRGCDFQSPGAGAGEGSSAGEAVGTEVLRVTFPREGRAGTECGERRAPAPPCCCARPLLSLRPVWGFLRFHGAVCSDGGWAPWALCVRPNNCCRKPFPPARDGAGDSSLPRCRDGPAAVGEGHRAPVPPHPSLCLPRSRWGRWGGGSGCRVSFRDSLALLGLCTSKPPAPATPCRGCVPLGAPFLMTEIRTRQGDGLKGCGAGAPASGTGGLGSSGGMRRASSQSHGSTWPRS